MKTYILTIGMLLSATPSFAQQDDEARLLFRGADPIEDQYPIILFEDTYDLGPGANQTGFFTVADAPVETNRIVVLQNGVGCNIYALRVLYLSDPEGPISQARQIGSDAFYEIPSGQIAELNLYFEQVGPRATCGIRIAAQEA